MSFYVDCELIEIVLGFSTAFPLCQCFLVYDVYVLQHDHYGPILPWLCGVTDAKPAPYNQTW